MSQVEIAFSVEGSVKQTIEIINPAYTPEMIVSGLASGKLATTIQEGGSVDVVATGEKVATVINIDNELGYFDFEQEEGIE
jgi:ABC-type molybdate transport system substrate-binding protein